MHFTEVRQNVAKPFCLSVHAPLHYKWVHQGFVQTRLVFQFHRRKTKPTDATPPFTQVAQSNNQFSEMHFATRGPRKCLSASGLQGQIFLPLLDFRLTPEKGHWQTHRRDSDYMCPTTSVTRLPCSQLQLWWLASISPAPHWISPLNWIECQTSSQSWRKPLEAEASRHTSSSRFSGAHIHKVLKEMRDSCCQLGCTFLFYYLLTSSKVEC